MLSDYIKKQAAMESLQKEIDALKDDGRLKVKLELNDRACIQEWRNEHGNEAVDSWAEYGF